MKYQNFEQFFYGFKMEDFIDEGFPDEQHLRSEIELWGQEYGWTPEEIEEQYGMRLSSQDNQEYHETRNQHI
jgi:hypothetical protein